MKNNNFNETGLTNSKNENENENAIVMSNANSYNTYNTDNTDDKKKKKVVNMFGEDDQTYNTGNTGNTYNINNTDNKKKKKVVNMFGEDGNYNTDNKKKKKVINMFGQYGHNYNTDDKKKKKKKIISNTFSYNDKKKKKKIAIMAGIPWDQVDNKTKKRIELDGMKKELIKIRYGNFLDIDVSDRTPYWGLGVEHEMHLFHKARNGMQNTHILFDSQESTCFLSNDHQSCCKYRGAKCDDFIELAKQQDTTQSNFGLTGEELQYLKNMQWEISGRQIKSCRRPGEYSEIIKRVPIMMPELISTNFSNRTIDSIAKEIISLEKHFIDIHMKNPNTKQKVDMYGPLTTHFCGSSSDILVPEHPVINNKEYIFNKAKMTDYLGSYHITITLPHTRDTKTSEFVKMHQNMAQQLQWIEPLLLTAFFSPTEKAVGNPNEPEGSFRVMTIGWGNFAGSDVRKMGTQGLTRGANIKSSWRNGLEFTRTKKLNYCTSVAPLQYKKSKSVHTGDFRTFGFEYDMDKCAELYTKGDCPRADGKPMAPPYGLEIRIFDHFPSEYLIELLRIVVLLAANAQRHPAKEYVYRDVRWKKAIHAIMKDGWNSIVDVKYITALRANLGLPIHTTSVLAYDILKQIVKELYEINKHSFINKIMNENIEQEPVVPEINRICWEMAFTNHYNTSIINFMKRTFYNQQVISINEFIKMMKQDPKLNFQMWVRDLNDVLYSLESHNHVQLEVFNGKIKNIKIML